jgi:hypothetical protein
VTGIETVDTDGALADDTGLVIVDGVDAADAAGVEDLFDGTNLDLELATADDDLYLLSDDGTDSYLFKLTGAGGNTEIAEAEVALVATFEGVNDATTLTAANFADFA